MKYESAYGKVIEREFPEDDFPLYIDVDGVRYSYCVEGASPAPNGIVRDERHVAYSMERVWQDPTLREVWGKFDERGRVLCEGKRDRVELAARLKASPYEKHRAYRWDY